MAFFSGSSGSSLQSWPNIVAVIQTRCAQRHQEQVKTPLQLSSKKLKPCNATGLQAGNEPMNATTSGFGHTRTAEVGDGVGDGERGADALAAPGHVLAEQQLREPLFHHLHLWQFQFAHQQHEGETDRPTDAGDRW